MVKIFCFVTNYTLKNRWYFFDTNKMTKTQSHLYIHKEKKNNLWPLNEWNRQNNEIIYKNCFIFLEHKIFFSVDQINSMMSVLQLWTKTYFPISSRRLTHESNSAEVFSSFEWLPLFTLPSARILRMYLCFDAWRTATCTQNTTDRIANEAAHSYVAESLWCDFSVFVCCYAYLYLSMSVYIHVEYSTFNIQCMEYNRNIQRPFNCIWNCRTLFIITTTAIIGRFLVVVMYMHFMLICSLILNCAY